mgnify:CR=1 FL=1
MENSLTQHQTKQLQQVDAAGKVTVKGPGVAKITVKQQQLQTTKQLPKQLQ